MTKKRQPERSPLMASPSLLPRSLLAFIRRREKIAQAIESTREQIAVVRRQMRDLEKIKKDLTAIDRTLGFHRIQIDPENIRPIHNKYKRLNLPYGEMSRCIFAAIKANEGPTQHAAIYEYIVARHPTLAPDKQATKDVKRSLHDRLKVLGREGRLERHHRGHEDGVCSFPRAPD